MHRKGKLKKTLIVLTAAVFLFSGLASARACTSFYMGKETTENGSYIWGRSEDISASYGKIFDVHPAETHEPGDMYISGTWNSTNTVFTPKFKWPYPEKTLRYTLCADSILNEREAPEPYAEVGTNEKGVSISSTVTLSSVKSQISSRDASVSRNNGGLAEIDVASVVLMQAETARGACELVASIIDQCGASGREGFMVSDPNEVWYFQWLTGHQYVAVKCPDDRIGFSPNITGNVGDEDGYVDVTDTENVIVSPGFVSIPKEADVLVAKDNDTKVKVADTYSSSTTNYQSGRMRVGYGYLYGLTTATQVSETLPGTKYMDYFAAPRQGEKYSLYEALRLLGCRGEGTAWEQANPTGNGSSIGNAATVEAHVFENRPDMPAELATIEWICLAPAEFGVYLPYYGNLVTEVFEKNYSPDRNSFDSADIDNNSMYRIFRQLYTDCAGTTAANRSRWGDSVRAFWEKYQKSLIEQQADVDDVMHAISVFEEEAFLQQKATMISKTVSEHAFGTAKKMLAELRAFKNTSGGGTGGSDPFVPTFYNDPAYMPSYAALLDDYVIPETDKSALQAAIGVFEAAQKPIDWTHNAYLNAKDVDAAKYVKQSDIDAATAALTAINAVIDTVCQISELSEFFQTLTPESYIPETWAPAQEAHGLAQAVLANPDATADEIITACASLDNAIRNLVKAGGIMLAPSQPSQIRLRVGQTYTIALKTEFSFDQLVFTCTPANFVTFNEQTGTLKCVKGGGTVLLMIKSVYASVAPCTIMVTTQA